jgi:hypothetical protein
MLTLPDQVNERGRPIYHLDYTADGERILRQHIQQALDRAGAERDEARFLYRTRLSEESTRAVRAETKARVLAEALRVAIEDLRCACRGAEHVKRCGRRVASEAFAKMEES